MPQSKTRKPHHQPHPVPPRANKTKKGRAALAAMVLFGLLGFAIGYFTTGGNPTSYIAGAIIGAGAGFLAGYLMDKSLEKK